MSNKNIESLVHSRLSDTGAIAPNSLHPVTIRIDPELLASATVIAEYLGYSSRSHLLRDLIESSFEDLVVETAKALRSDSTVSDQFRSDLYAVLGSVQS